MKNLTLEFFDQAFSGNTDNIDAQHAAYRYAFCATVVATALSVQVARNSLTNALGHMENF